LRAETYLCAVLAILFVIGSSSGQIAEFEKRGRGPAGSMEPAVVLGTSGEPQGLLPSIETVQYQTEGGWSSWTIIKGTKVTTSPAIVSAQPEAVDVFMGGGENELWHVRHYKVWSAWKKLFGQPPYNVEPQGVPFRKYELAVAYTGSDLSEGCYHIFTWGPTNHCLYKKCSAFEGSAACNQDEDWIKIEGEIGSRPSATVNSGELYLLALNSSGWLIWNKADPESTNSVNGLIWTGWAPLQGPFKSSPTTVSDENTTQIFVLNEEGEVVHLQWFPATGEISNETIAYKMKSTPSAALYETGIHLFGVEGRDLIHTWHDGISWKEWDNLGGDLTGQPAAVSDRPDRIRVFARGPGERLWEIDYVPENWTIGSNY